MKKEYSLIALAILLVIYLLSVHLYKRWNHNILGGGDPWGYYVYLPATFIHHDLLYFNKSLEAREKHNGINRYSTINPLGVDEVRHIGDGKQVAKYTLGLAILFAPFFFIAHLLALISNYPADGYSFIYDYCIILSAVFYTMLGLFFLRKVLLEYVSEIAAAITLLIIGLGTNLYFFTIINGPMSHAYLFCLYSILMYLTIRWHKDFKSWQAISIGAVAGLITLIRPTEILCILIPLLWNISSFTDVKNRVRLIGQRFPAYSLAVLAFIAVGLPQIFYWKYATGQFLFYSYGEEGFDFLHAHIYHGLFGFKNGWLTYTPVMFFALAGIPFLFKHRAFLLPVLIILPLHIYIIYSWWAWMYINGFGSRPMVEMYALLAIPLAHLIHFATKRNFIIIILSPILLFFIWLNLFHTYQFTLGIMWSQDASWAYYKAVLSKTKLNYLDLVTFDTGETQPDTSKIRLVKELYYNDFEDSLSVNYITTDVKNGTYSFMLDNATFYSPGLASEWKDLNISGGKWIKASVWCLRKYTGNDLGQTSNLTISFEKDGVPFKWINTRLDNKTGNTNYNLWGGAPNVWEQVYFWSKIPADMQSNQVLKVYVWNGSSNQIFLDDLRVELWE